MNTYRILILGAGFSKPAGLPLAFDLFQEVRKRVKVLHGADNHLESDIEYYLSYLRHTEGFKGSAENINIERFLSFLDVEHYLGFKGSDTWSSDGNLTQLLIRHTIGYVLWDRTPKKVPEVYKHFARKLTTTDWILTFNYNTLLEQALESVGTPYRLFPERYSEIGISTSTVDTSHDEVVILKMHGSVDWVNKTTYNEHVKYASEYPLPYTVKHPVFGPNAVVASSPIVDGPRSIDDPLLQFYRVKEPSSFYSTSYWECAPFILSPSYSKLLYAKPLADFWRGLGKSGGLNLGLGIVGYSLPNYDDYACQAIYKIAQNYQGYEPNLELNGRVKRPIRILDFRHNKVAKSDLRTRYGFLRQKHTEYWYDGFSDSGIEWFMS